MSEKITILYVDDEASNLLLFSVNFRKKFNVLTAKSGRHGLDVLKDNPSTRVVISDMRMPEMNGLEFIRIARDEFPSVSFFLLTGYDLTEEIAEALKEGLIHKFFRKPIETREVEESILAAAGC